MRVVGRCVRVGALLRWMGGEGAELAAREM